MPTDTFVCSGKTVARRFKVPDFDSLTNVIHFDIAAHHRYPSINPRSEYNEVKTYSGPIGSVRFMNGDRSLVTVGGTDASLMIWDLIEE